MKKQTEKEKVHKLKAKVKSLEISNKMHTEQINWCANMIFAITEALTNER